MFTYPEALLLETAVQLVAKLHQSKEVLRNLIEEKLLCRIVALKNHAATALKESAKKTLFLTIGDANAVSAFMDRHPVSIISTASSSCPGFLFTKFGSRPTSSRCYFEGQRHEGSGFQNNRRVI